MKPLVVLLGVFTVSLFAIRFVTGEFDYSLAGRIAMAAMLVFTAIGHFSFVEGMTMMMPAFFPFKREIIYLTGVIELAAAAGLFLCHQSDGGLTSIGRKSETTCLIKTYFV